MGRASKRKHRRRGQSVDAPAHDTPAAGAVKLSQALLEVIAPYREDGLSRESYKALIAAAATAWNLCALPEGEREQALLEALRDVQADEPEVAAQLVQALMRRKQQLFPYDGRMIAHWEVTESDDEYRLIVASTAP